MAGPTYPVLPLELPGSTIIAGFAESGRPEPQIDGVYQEYQKSPLRDNVYVSASVILG